MRFHGVLMVVYALATALSVAAALVGEWRLCFECGSAGLLALAAYVVVAGGALRPRVRWALAGGVLLLAGAELYRRYGYADVDPAALVNDTRLVVEQAERALDVERVAAVGVLLVLGCLLVAMTSLPAHRDLRWIATVAVAAFVLAAVLVLAGFWLFDEPVKAIAGTWPMLLVALLATAVAGYSGVFADRRWLLPIGAVLFAFCTAVSAADAIGQWYTSWSLSGRDRPGFQITAIAISTASPSLDITVALWIAAVFGAPALIVRGVLAAAAPAEPVPSAGQP